MADFNEEAPVISVLMVSGGNPEMSATAVETLKKHSSYDCQLVFVDNGSARDEDLSGHIKPLLNEKDVFIRNEVFRSFARANNQAASVADGKHLLCLNNDTVTEGDWQTPLLEGGKKFDLCGPSVRQLAIVQEIKAMMCRRVDGVMYDADVTDVGAYIEGWCLFLHKDYYRQLGGFDEAFWPMFCEDSDLSFRVTTSGGKLGKVSVPIKHLGSRDSLKYLKQTWKDTVNMANNHKMYARWVQGAVL